MAKSKYDIFSDLVPGRTSMVDPVQTQQPRTRSKYDIFDDLVPKASPLTYEEGKYGGPGPDMSQSIVQSQPITDQDRAEHAPGQLTQPQEPGWLAESKNALIRGGLRFGASVPGTMASILKLGKATSGMSPYSVAAEQGIGMKRDQDIKKLQSMAKSIYDEAGMESLRSQKKGAGSYILNTTLETLPMMAASVAAAVTTGPIGAIAVAGMAEGESAYQEAKNSGADEGTAQTERLIVGTINGLIEQMQAAKILKIGKEVAGPALQAIKTAIKDKAYKRLGKEIGKIGLKQVATAVSEGVEEALQETVAMGAAKIGHDGSFDLAKIPEAFVGGVVAGGILGAAGSLANTAIQTGTQDQAPATKTTDVGPEPVPSISDLKIGEGAPSIETLIEQKKAESEQREANARETKQTRTRLVQDQVRLYRAWDKAESGTGEQKAIGQAIYDIKFQIDQIDGVQDPIDGRPFKPPEIEDSKKLVEKKTEVDNAIKERFPVEKAQKPIIIPKSKPVQAEPVRPDIKVKKQSVQKAMADFKANQKAPIEMDRPRLVKYVDKISRSQDFGQLFDDLKTFTEDTVKRLEAYAKRYPSKFPADMRPILDDAVRERKEGLAHSRLLKQHERGSSKATNKLINMNLPTYEELLAKAQDGDQDAAQQIVDGRYRELIVDEPKKARRKPVEPTKAEKVQPAPKPDIAPAAVQEPTVKAKEAPVETKVEAKAAEPVKTKEDKGVFDPKNPPAKEGSNISAIKLDDGTILFDKNAKVHADMLESLKIDTADIADGGFIIRGEYVSGSADIPGIAAQAKAKKRVEQLLVERTKPTPTTPVQTAKQRNEARRADRKAKLEARKKKTADGAKEVKRRLNAQEKTVPEIVETKPVTKKKTLSDQKSVPPKPPVVAETPAKVAEAKSTEQLEAEAKAKRKADRLKKKLAKIDKKAKSKGRSGMSPDQRDRNPIGARVEDAGGIQNPGNKFGEQDAFLNVPLRFRASKGTGQSIDEMLGMLQEEGLLDDNATMYDLAIALQGSKKSIETTAKKFAKQQDAKEAQATKNHDRVGHRDLAEGDVFEINGETFKVDKETDTALRVKDGVDFWIPFESDETILIDKGTLKKSEKARPEETDLSGDFTQGLEETTRPPVGISKGLSGQTVFDAGSTSGTQFEMFNKEDTKTTKAITEDAEKNDAVGQMTLGGTEKQAPPAKPKPKPPKTPPKDQGDLFEGDTPLPPPKGPGLGPQAGTAPIIEDVATAIASHGMQFAGNVSDLTKSVLTLLKRNLKAATTFMRTLGNAGKATAEDIDEITFKVSQHTGTDEVDIRRVFKGTNKAQRVKIAKGVNKRIKVADLPKWMRPRVEQLRAILDRSMNAARELNVQRNVRGQKILIGGSGKAFPQIPNAAGIKFLEAAKEESFGNPEVLKWANQQVAAGKFESQASALKALNAYHDSMLRGTNQYLESFRVELDEDMIEWDGSKVLPQLLEKNWMTVEGVRKWGLDFTVIDARVEIIKDQYGNDAAQRVKSFVQTSFGLASPASQAVTKISNMIRAFQFITKVATSPLTVLRNMSDRIGKGMMISPTGFVRATVEYPPFVNAFIKSSQAIEERMIRGGAVFGHGSLSEGYEAGNLFSELTSAPFTTSERGNQVFIAQVAYHKLMYDLHILETAREGTISKALNAVQTVFGVSEKQAEARVGSRLLGKIDAGQEITQDDVYRFLHEAVRDKAFPMILSTKPIWYDSHPMMKVLAQFKTWPVRQTKMIWDDVLKYTVKTGDMTRLIGFVTGTLIAGELYNIMRDFFYEKEESVLSQLQKPTEDQKIARAVLSDLVDGGLVGMLADFSYGIKDWALGVSANTGKNVSDAFTNIRKAPRLADAALVKLLMKEVAPARQIKSLMTRLNKESMTHDYQKYRAISWQFKEGVQNPTVIKKIQSYTDDVVYGFKDYGISEKTLAYEMLSRQVVAGDTKKAARFAEYLYDLEPDDRKAVEKGLVSSMNRRAPFGVLNHDEQAALAATMSPEELARGKAAQARYKSNYKRAVIRGRSQSKRVTTTK